MLNFKEKFKNNLTCPFLYLLPTHYYLCDGRKDVGNADEDDQRDGGQRPRASDDGQRVENKTEKY